LSHRASVIVPSLTGKGLDALLDSLAGQTAEHQVIVVDNGCPDGSVERACEQHPGVEHLRFERNLGFSRAANQGAARAEGDVLLMVNDDVVCDSTFVEELSSAVDPGAGITMASGVLRDAQDPHLIETAGVLLDHTLLAFDYLNGEPVSILDGEPQDPPCPVGAAAAFDRDAFNAVGGFDERIFAYWEEVELSLRLIRDGGRCRLARRAQGTHRHASTLGAGSVGKNYLTGFGRGYVLRKWNAITPRRLPAILVREIGVCLAHAVVDRNLASIRGRAQGYRAARPTEAYPAELFAEGGGPSAMAQLRARVRRRLTLRRQRAA
jgi:N-acetylglucosaminyl-diphospho-decaprenol L-rhamnosyltransferase